MLAKTVSYFNEKQGDIILSRYRGFFELESKEKLGSIHQNILSASYGFKWKTRYIDPYFSLGLGLYLPYVQYNGTSYIESLPTISSAIGVGFEYGFVDLAVNYLPMKWTGVFEYQEEGSEQTFREQTRLVGNLRLGVGFPF